MRLFDIHALSSSLLLISASILATSTLAQSEGVHSTTTDDGLTIEYTDELTCLRPTKKGDEIMVHYRGTLESNGNEFDSSFGRGAPFSFYLGKGQVIKGWDEGLLDMCAGENRTLIIPPELGYGNRAIGPIPKGSTLIFETSLVGVIGVPKEDIEGHAIEPEVAVPFEDEDDKEQQEEPAFPDADIPPVDFNSIPPAEGEENDANLNDNLDTLPSISSHEEQPPPKAEDVEDVEETQTPDDDEQVEDLLSADDNGPMAGILTLKKNECRLLGPFALVVQGALGLLALLSLVFKRWRERPRRPLKVWFFDCSKQVLGTFLLHLANLAMSMFSSGSLDVQARDGGVSDAAKHGSHGDQPNPCSFYLLNLAIDTTIGIPVLVVLLKVFHALFLRTALANPPESIKSGYYGTPARWTWFLKQCLIYFLGLMGMKLFVLFIFAVLPWIGWVGDWALRWTEGNEALQIAFVMFIFPVLMNAIQYYVVDSFIKENKGPEIDREGFRRVNTDDSEHGSYHSREDDDEEGEDVVAEVIDEQAVKKTANAKAREADLQEINPTPLPAYEDEGSGSSIDEARK